MQSSDTVAQAVTLLAPLAAGGAAVAQGVAVKVLGDVVSQRLRRDGQASAWEEFRAHPQNGYALRHYLQQIASQDAEFRRELEAAVAAALSERSSGGGPRTINLTGSGQAQIGDRGDTITGSRVASRGSSYHEGHVYNTTRNRVTHKKNHFGVLAVIAVIAVIAVVLLIKGLAAAAGGSGLSASSTCTQFLNADEQTQQQALVNIALSKGIGGFGSPLALPEIQYECSSLPTMTLGALIERDKGEF